MFLRFLVFTILKDSQFVASMNNKLQAQVWKQQASSKLPPCYSFKNTGPRFTITICAI